MPFETLITASLAAQQMEALALSFMVSSYLDGRVECLFPKPRGKLHSMIRFAGETLPLDDLRHPTLRQAYAYWSSKTNGREFPSRNDISPEEMKPFLQHIMLVDVSYDPMDFVYRVFGTGIAAAYKEDYTGKSVHALEPKPFAELIWEQYCEALERRVPILHGVLLLTATRYLRYHRLILPLSSDGTSIDKLLAVSIEDGKFWDAVAKTELAGFGQAAHSAEEESCAALEQVLIE